MENDFAKFLLVLLVIIYVLSPVDAVPGPIDDAIVVLLAASANKKQRLFVVIITVFLVAVWCFPGLGIIILSVSVKPAAPIAPMSNEL